jgi:hypothetical protein
MGESVVSVDGVLGMRSEVLQRLFGDDYGDGLDSAL